MRRLASVATVAGLGALLVAASPAAGAAGDDARVVIVNRTINAGAMAGEVVPCGPGERAIGGGAGWAEQSLSKMTSSAPVDASQTVVGTDDGDIPVYWFSEVHNDTAGSIEYKFHAVCSASSDATVQREQRHLAAPTMASEPTLGSQFATCPAGQRAISGGVTYDLPTVVGGTRIDASGPLDETGSTANTQTGDVARTWYAEFRNNRVTSGQVYSVYAVCSPTSRATVRVQEIIVGTGASSLACPAGSRAIGGGGVSPTTSNQTSFSASGPTDSTGFANTLFTGDAPRAWRSQAHTASLAPISIKHSVICDPATPAASQPPAGRTGQRAAALKKCKKKRRKKARKKCRRKAALLPI